MVLFKCSVSHNRMSCFSIWLTYWLWLITEEAVTCRMAVHHYIWLINKPIFKCKHKSNNGITQEKPTSERTKRLVTSPKLTFWLALTVLLRLTMSIEPASLPLTLRIQVWFYFADLKEPHISSSTSETKELEGRLWEGLGGLGREWCRPVDATRSWSLSCSVQEIQSNPKDTSTEKNPQATFH